MFLPVETTPVWVHSAVYILPLALISALTLDLCYSSREQIVTFYDIDSDTCIALVPTGICQGTIIGPLVFIFYMNDIVDKLSMYAGDCVLYFIRY